ncbi:MAG: hypothetical protein E7046_08885 [Lentisphaerae bacterium]|nr:hypothetical protein [Lentisphaerota bacterium]
MKGRIDLMTTTKTLLLVACAGAFPAFPSFGAPVASFIPSAHTGTAIQQAIDAASAAGGGRVVLEKAVYPSGTIYLKSRVELHVPEGATILGNDTPDGYDDVDDPRIGVVPELSAKAFIACLDAEDVSITGSGVIDGQGLRFYDTKTTKGRFFRKPPHPRPRMVEFFNCRNVRFEDVTFKDSPGWTCWIRKCQNFTAERVKIHGDQRMINNDGFHVDCCQHVRIRNCDIRTGDDCVIMRAIRPQDGAFDACEDMVVEDCSLDSACQCIRLTCPSDGTIRNGTFRNLKMRGYNGVVSGHPVQYLRKGDSGSCLMQNILVENCDIDVRNGAILFNVEPGIILREFGNVTFRNVNLKSVLPLQFQGTGDTVLRNIRLENVTGTVAAEQPFDMKCVENITFEHFNVTSGSGKKSPSPAIGNLIFAANRPCEKAVAPRMIACQGHQGAFR